MFDYLNYLASKLDLYNTDNLTIRVENEQIFQNEVFLQENEIYVVVRRLQNIITWESITEPIQITILSESNSVELTKALFERLATGLNWETLTEVEGDTTWTIKQQYSSPVDMNNFIGVANSYRSVLYVQANILYLKNVVNVDTIKIDGIDIKPLSMSIAYQMSGNTQQISGDFLATTEKSVSTLNISLTLPLQDIYKLENQTKTVEVLTDGQTELIPSTYITEISDNLAIKDLNKVVFHTLGEQTIKYTYRLINAILLIKSGRYSGNKKFRIKIDNLFIDRDFKITGITDSFAPNSVPSLVIGLIA